VIKPKNILQKFSFLIDAKWAYQLPLENHSLFSLDVFCAVATKLFVHICVVLVFLRHDHF